MKTHKNLTPRETEVFLLAAKGMTKDAIGKKLSIGLDTVDTHLVHVRLKLNLKSLQQLTLYAVKNKLIKL